jgi:quinoprotein dehydrogenase-associated probable ABC transporter substrate-binding protein
MRHISEIAIAAAIALSATHSTAERRELRVCADPNNLPFSNQRLEGFENRMAELVAAEMHATLRYTWMPQRRGFIRRTLKAKECDLVTGVPTGLEMVLPTKPYYRSTYVFVYRKNSNLRIRSFDDPALQEMRIGLHAIGEDGFNPPPAHALARRGIVKNVVGFRMQDVDSVDSPPGRIIDAVAAGQIDIAIVWGPFAGYFARRQKVELEVVPVSPNIDPPGLAFEFDLSMGVRRGDTALKDEVDGILDRRRRDIETILKDYGIPLVKGGPDHARSVEPALGSRSRAGAVDCVADRAADRGCGAGARRRER